MKANHSPAMVDAMMREYDGLRKEISDASSARLNILGFTVTAIGAILGFTSQQTGQAGFDYFLLVATNFALALLIAAQLLTTNYSQGIRVAGTYIKIFIEPYIEGIKWETRLANLREGHNYKSNWTQTSRLLGFYYAFLTLAVALTAYVFSLYHFTPSGILISLLTIWSLSASCDLMFHLTKGWNISWSDDKTVK